MIYKNKDGSFCKDLFDSNFDGNADRIYQQQLNNKIEEEKKLQNKIEKIKQIEKQKEIDFWKKHPNDGWLNFD